MFACIAGVNVINVGVVLCSCGVVVFFWYGGVGVTVDYGGCCVCSYDE